MSLRTAGSVSRRRTRGDKHGNKSLNLCYVIHLFKAPPLTLCIRLAYSPVSACYLVLICLTCIIIFSPFCSPIHKCPHAHSNEHTTGACGLKKTGSSFFSSHREQWTTTPPKIKTEAWRLLCSAISMRRKPSLNPVIIPLMVAFLRHISSAQRIPLRSVNVHLTFSCSCLWNASDFFQICCRIQT